MERNKRRNSKVTLTDFQLRVFEEALKIPWGEVRTYSWIAKRIGSPSAVRAVGSALRKNPYPLLIPCHRVVRSNGDIGRYSRGKEVKSKLIEFERRLKNIFATAKTPFAKAPKSAKAQKFLCDLAV